MAIFKEFGNEDVKTSKSFLNQLVDIVNTDISSSTSRKKYQLWVTGGVGPGVTSSLFQTVFDQDFTLQTANAVFDMTFGLASGSNVISASTPSIDSNGKYIFPSNTLMMREKMDVYKLFAQQLLGSDTAKFTRKNSAGNSDINEAMFVCFKRLFARDQVKRETFAIRFNKAANTAITGNLGLVSDGAASIYTDVNAAINKEFAYGGQVSNVVLADSTTTSAGQLFLDRGVLVLDTSVVFDITGTLSGTIDAVVAGGTTPFRGNFNELFASASLDDLIDHVASTRFSGSDDTSVTFQNVTNINSSLFFCRLTADEYNYSSNPTYVDSSGRIVVIDEGQEETQKSFTFVTSIGLYDAFDNLLGVAKVSRPVIKDSDRDVTFKVRMDY